MSNFITAEKWELISFFETEPSYLEPSDPWPYTDAVFEIQRETLSFSCAINPAYKDIRIILNQNGKKVYELNAMAILDIIYKKEYNAEYLEFIIDNKSKIILRVNPSIEIAETIKSKSE
jgi:hypothetical protein